MRRQVVTAFLIFLLSLSTLTFLSDLRAVSAYNASFGETHYFIFDQAKTILSNDGYGSYASYLDREYTTGTTYLDKIKEGSYEADNYNPVPYVASGDHYMSPFDHEGLNFLGLHQFSSAARLCQEKFDLALTNWADGSYGDAMIDLGWAAHLVQDLCVPFHAAEDTGSVYPNHHKGYEDWVQSHQNDFAVSSGGIYSFESFPDRQYYPTYNTDPPFPEAYRHYNGVSPIAYDWADYNAHESIKYYPCVNSATGYWDNVADPWVETVHDLPNNLDTTFTIAMFSTYGFQLYFSHIHMQPGDYVRIYDGNNNILASYTNIQGEFWTPQLYSSSDILRIRTTTDGTSQSWGFRITHVKVYDYGDAMQAATSVLLPRAQRTTAGFIKFFFDKVFGKVFIRSDGSVDPAGTPIQREGNVYTLTGDVSSSIEVQRDNVTIDGNGHLLQAPYGNISDGLFFSGRSYGAVRNLSISGFCSGICLLGSTHMRISGNRITDNDRYGIYFQNSSGNDISENQILGNFYGICLENSSSNNIAKNSLAECGQDGIGLYSSSKHNYVAANSIEGNAQDGITLRDCSGFNEVVHNEIRNNTRLGITIVSATQNRIFHNEFENTFQAYCDSVNTWDNGYPSGGNYWSDYGGFDEKNGPGQDQPGSDGVGDTRYTINTYNTDHYPLMEAIVQSVRVNPQYADLGQAYVGQIFDVSVAVESVYDLYGLSVQIGWDTSWISYVSHTKMIPVETYIGGVLHSPTLEVQEIIDEVNPIPGTAPGTHCWIAEASMHPAAGFVGDGVVVVLTFEVARIPTQGEGHITTPIYFTNSDLSDSFGVSIAHAAVDGTVVLHGPTALKVVPEVTEFPPGYAAGSTFAVAVTVENVVNFYGFDIQLAWDSSLLEYASHVVKIPVEVYPDGVLHSPVLPVMDDVDLVAGTYWIAYASMPPALGFVGSGTVVVFTFRVVRQPTPSEGDVMTSIRFTSSDLADSMGIPIGHVAVDGLVILHGSTTVKVVPEVTEFPPGYAAGSTFAVAVTVENVVNFYGFDIQLAWDTEYLEYLGRTVTVPAASFPAPNFPSTYGGALNAPTLEVKNIVDENGGIPDADPASCCWFAYASMLPAAAQTGDVTIVVFTFRVVRQPTPSEGDVMTSIRIVVSSLANSGGTGISHATVDGLVILHGPTAVRVVPEVKELSPGYAVGSTFTVAARVENVIDLYGLSLQFAWNTSLLEYVSRAIKIPVETCPGGVLHSPVLPVMDDVDLVAGTYWIAYASMSPAASFTGDGTVVVFTFRVVRQPTPSEGDIMTSIRFTNSDLSSSGGYPIGHATADGLVILHGPTTVKVVPEVTEFPPSYVVGSIFTVAVTVENVVNFYGFDLQIAWNTTYLEYVSHTVTVPAASFPAPNFPSTYGGALNAPTLEVKNIVDENGGIPDADPASCCWFAYASMLPAAGFTGDGVLFTMTFKIRNQPVTDIEVPFNFTSVSLANSGGMEIPCARMPGLMKIPGLVRDVAIVDTSTARALKTIVNVGQSMALNVTLANQGYVLETVDIAIYANDTLVGSLAGVSLQNGTTILVTFTWDTTGFAYGNYTLKAVATPVQDETDIEDNTKYLAGPIKVTIPGDVDGDFDVDIFDVVRITACYSKKQGDTAYNSNSDINDDGQITILDVVLCTGHYGQKWP